MVLGGKKLLFHCNHQKGNQLNIRQVVIMLSLISVRDELKVR